MLQTDDMCLLFASIESKILPVKKECQEDAVFLLHGKLELQTDIQRLMSKTREESVQVLSVFRNY